MLVTLTSTYAIDYTRQYVSIPEQYFNDPSALNVKSNLQSKQYHDFIHTLYRYDKANLQKVDQLFENAATSSGKTPTLKLASSPPQRKKREIIFRPLFLYREQNYKKEHIPEKFPYQYQHQQHYEPVAQSQNYFDPDYSQNTVYG